MSNKSKERILDRGLLKRDLDNFIPIACHIDKRTLITKNGELVQIIKIRGLDSDFLNEDLSKLRESIREAINLNITDNVAIWVNTIRTKANLDDLAPYPHLISTNIHRIWNSKNYWNDKFVNTLYISFVYKGARFNTKNIYGFINSLFIKNVYKFHDQFIENALLTLTRIVDNVFNALKSFNPKVLEIEEINGIFVSQQTALYSDIITTEPKEFGVDIYDLSQTISQYNLAVGGNVIEIENDKKKKFASILSIKDYKDIKNANLYKVIDLPIQMVITEIFYLANKSEIQNKFKFQNDILKVSKADNLAEIKEFDKIFESDENTNFYNQQISIMCISDEINDLSRKVSLMSQGLSKLGIIHVKEDILLENAYWSQVPGNFNFLKRVYLNTKSQICAFASLENVHSGRKSSKLGKAITILRTNKGTPYFFNFHDKSGNGNTIIIGKKKSGKTVITNFLISETTKYQPTILYFHADDSPTVFIKSIGGELLSNIDQFNQLNSLSSIELIKKSLTLMLLGYDTENSKDYENIINALAQYCFDNEHPKFQEFSNKYSATNEAEIKIKQYLEFFGQNEYEKFFIKNNNQYFKSQTITGVALNSFQNEIFKKNHFSEDEKDLNLYSMKLKLNNNFKNMLAVSLINEFCNIDDSGLKIIVFDDLLKIFSPEFFKNKDIKTFFNTLEAKNCIIVANCGIEDYIGLSEYLDIEKLTSLFQTKITLASDSMNESVKKIFCLDDEEYLNFTLLSHLNRMLLIRQDDHTAILELSLGGLQGILKILSAASSDVKIFKEMLSKFGSENDEWIKALYLEYNK